MEKLRQRCGRRAGFLVGAPAESVGPGWGLAPAAPGWDNGEEIAVAYLITTHRSPAGPLLVKCGNATGWPVGTGGGGAPAGGQVRGAGPGGMCGAAGGTHGLTDVGLSPPGVVPFVALLLLQRRPVSGRALLGTSSACPTNGLCRANVLEQTRRQVALLNATAQDLFSLYVSDTRMMAWGGHGGAVGWCSGDRDGHGGDRGTGSDARCPRS